MEVHAIQDVLRLLGAVHLLEPRCVFRLLPLLELQGVTFAAGNARILVRDNHLLRVDPQVGRVGKTLTLLLREDHRRHS